ncbi:MAG: PAS domain S-box protein [Reyranella sp.]|uniref:PAS domain S-box protein n=1 Tax=Reyranella sp. TaxID=1929291 RepID=UPI001AD45587|nr:PAS domain S-box protein [Reyranella sp.]MBN9089887.1 PAS domain S-box protein [Reyranella sp.]
MSSVNEYELARLFVDELSDYAIAVVDSADRILIWNAGARALLGYSADEAIGASFSQLYARMDPEASETGALITSAAPLGRHETNRQLVRKDGIRFQANIVARPITDAANTVVGFGLIVHDIDRSRRLAAAVPSLPAAADAPVRGIAKILVVDDNQGVLGIATDQLTSLGYSVIAATNGADALELLRQDNQIELLFTDVVMPGELAGRDLAARAMAIRPGLKVLFASGYVEDALVGKGQLAPNVQFLPKPYRKHELARKVEDVLSRL